VKKVKVVNNKIFLEPRECHTLVCSDCGVVHNFKYRRTLLGIVLEIWRNDAETVKEKKKRVENVAKCVLLKKVS
jgi:hypothetical protein